MSVATAGAAAAAPPPMPTTIAIAAVTTRIFPVLSSLRRSGAPLVARRLASYHYNRTVNVIL
jgi:hypothetical protein